MMEANVGSKGLNYYNLRIIAYISLLTDHFGVLILDDFWGDTEGVGELLVLATRLVGRLAMPIFAFFIAEGMIRTKNRKRYILRLIVLALITEIPYNLVLSGQVIYLKSQNVIWSLIAGAVLILICDSIKKRFDGQKYIFLCTLAFVLMAALMCLMRTEYKILAPAIILLAYVFRYDKHKMICSMMASFIILYALDATMSLLIADRVVSLSYVATSVLLEFVGMFGIYLIAEYYNAEKGKNIPRVINYGFFPLQFLFFYVLRLLIF